MELLMKFGLFWRTDVGELAVEVVEDSGDRGEG